MSRWGGGARYPVSHEHEGAQGWRRAPRVRQNQYPAVPIVQGPREQDQVSDVIHPVPRPEYTPLRIATLRELAALLMFLEQAYELYKVLRQHRPTVNGVLVHLGALMMAQINIHHHHPKPQTQSPSHWYLKLRPYRAPTP